ncbi:MAG: bifunctional folylpolyglutamate synthase/dihydrofolate synthase [Limnochordia bacterium]|jgi:dihydrofolate synthase/folylpolyglutamate synthase
MKAITSRARFGSHLGLERITLVCKELGDPQTALRFIHVAGTNGKGSVCAFLASSLAAAGYKVGRFTSPHLVSYRERIAINGVPIDDEDLSTLGAAVDEACRAVEESYPDLGAVTEFEYATALAFCYFQRAGVDVVVLETGLGGRLDATNVVTPDLCVITPIGYDHMDRLGYSLKEIAWEKAGIIKPGVPVVVAYQRAEAYHVLISVAHDRKAPIALLAEWEHQALGWDLAGGKLLLPEISPTPFAIRLLGDHQLQNAATAALALHQLTALGWQISAEHIRVGLSHTEWPGRLEVVSTEPLVVLDGAHNEDGLKTLAAGLQHLGQGLDRRWTFVFGMLFNKDLALLDLLLPLAERFVFTQAESARLAPMPPEAMAAYVQAKQAPAEVRLPAGEALRTALSTPPICVCGSLYLIGNIKRDLAGLGIVTQ